ncbi:uncharacterized protein LOC130623439 isoform X2 [Hydractinia symbiolongicarpus]|uniref:uncharacterized protein LOC130623439 isoform X2 n=1 Tax=Hydractinia symbiolongicarpus TaxID=13093 RepID=UPI0025517C70|nr:uncharacterized protein LOC130623439 isoform X2 [Hydractinia symbiolongicarpus]
MPTGGNMLPLRRPFWFGSDGVKFISPNGAIFTRHYTTINPSLPFQTLPNYSILVYYADSMFSPACGACNLYYRTNISGSDLNKINAKLQKKDPLFNAVNGRILVVTWYQTKGFYANDVNTYQAILASDGSKTYAIINYDEITYYSSPTTPQVRLARVGFKVNNNKLCSFPGTRTNEVLKLTCRSNVFVPGLFVVGLTPNADFQCNSADNLPFDCSHCIGEQTWLTTTCPTVYSPVCGSNGVTYSNRCMFNRERCRARGNLTLARIGECTPVISPSSMVVQPTSVQHPVLSSATSETSPAMNVQPTISLRVNATTNISPSPPLTATSFIRSSLSNISMKTSIKATRMSTVMMRSSSFTSPPPPKNDTLLYPYGTKNGDRILPSGFRYTSWSYYISPMKLFSRTQSRFYIYVSGIITFGNSGYGSIPSSSTFISAYATELDTRYGRGTVYFRETKDYRVLARATRDVLHLHPYSKFRPTRALVVSYIDVSSYYGTNSKHTFQVIVATDETSTYGIMNYQRLDRSNAINGFSEGYCNFRLFQPRYVSTNLVHRSNIGVRGRHVYKLTKEECFKPLTGVYFVTQHTSFYSNYGTLGINYYFARNSVVEKPNVILLEMVTNDITNSICISSRNINDNRMYMTVSYILGRQGRPAYTSSQLNAMVVFGNVDEDETFQYGIIEVQSFTQNIRCNSYWFSSNMNANPTIKLTADIGRDNSQLSRHTNIWLRDVRHSGFKVCYKESMTYSGSRNISVHYMAVAEDKHNITEHGILMFSRGLNSSCKTLFFKLEYIGTPFVFVTPEEISYQGTRGVLISWVKTIRPTYAEVCAMHSEDDAGIRERDMTVHYLVQGKISPCNYVTCPDHLQCRLRANRTYCGCIQQCLNVSSSKTFCGTDFVTYASRCHLYKDHCERYKNLSYPTVKVAHMGKCERFPYQTGVTQLDNVPGIPTVFCKQITLNPIYFGQEGNISVQLTVSWGKVDTNNITHDATASWTEAISIRGFKACVMVAGRHYFGRFDRNPSVHWIAHQNGFSGGSGYWDSGVVNMPTWYTGSRCVSISSRTPFDAAVSFFATVEHTKLRAYENAMTAWAEETKFRSGYNVCARELQNFDGVHEGIRIHWMAINGNFLPFLTENKAFIYSGRYIALGSAIPVVCEKIEYNLQYPMLPNPTVLVSASIYTASVGSGFSNYDTAVWIEYAGVTHLKMCHKQLRDRAFTPSIRITYALLPTLCEAGYTYVKGSCYKDLKGCSPYEASVDRCFNVNGKLPTVTSASEAYFLEQAAGSGQTWIGLSDQLSERQWVWESGSTSSFRRWLPNKPDGGRTENCAVVDGSYNVSGWDDVSCSTCAGVKCQKDADFLKRSCSFYCLNGGSCLSTNQTNQTTTGQFNTSTSYNGTTGVNGLVCKCPEGVVGRRCNIDISSLTECHNYTTHTEAWRKHYRFNATYKPNTTVATFTTQGFTTTPFNYTYSYCDPRNLKNGWHRFNGAAGTRLLDYCTGSRNRCGTPSPGWVYGSHPTVEEGIVKRPLRFFTHYCADDSGEVLIRNCGNFYSYRFTKLPSWSCNYGVCTRD